MAPLSNNSFRCAFLSRLPWTALLLVSSTVSAQLRDLIPEWLPICFSRNETLLEMFTCLQDNVDTECFNDTSLQYIVKCTAEAVPDFELTSQLDVNATLDDLLDFNWTLLGDEFDDIESFYNSTRFCLDPYVDCVNASIQESIDSIDPCIRTTLSDLTKCAIDNADQCFSNCTDFALDAISDSTNPFSDFSDFNILSLLTCGGIQNNIVDPLCGTIECCQPCVEPYVDLMECIVNDVLDFTFFPCDFECPGEEERLRELRFLPEGSNTSDQQTSGGTSNYDVDTDEIVNSCLQYAPGLTGKDAEELVARVQVFLPCVHDEFLHVVREKHAAVVTTNATKKDANTESAVNNTVAGMSYSSAPRYVRGGIGLVLAALLTSIFSGI